MKKVFAVLMIAAMLLCFMPAMAFAEANAGDAGGNTEEPVNTNGIYFNKYAAQNANGTTDIFLEAYTTGTTQTSVTAVPNDIVLVLDVSGSMDQKLYTYTEADGYTYTTGSGWFAETHYGFNDNGNTAYYIQVDGEMVPVQKWGSDWYDFDIYYYGDWSNRTYVYPKLNSENGNRYYDYDVVQFYTRTESSETKMEILKNAVNSLIEETAERNEGVAAENQHRISIVKFAGYERDVVGNDTYKETYYDHGHSYTYEYNYTQIVKELTSVTGNAVTELKESVNGLAAKGATLTSAGMSRAEAALGEKKAGRNQVVIVFTDGVPTSGSEYEEDVANSALTTSKSLKDAGAKVFTVCINDGADVNNTSSNLNKFMHYLSSNYPEATTMNNSGEGSITAGYYKVPSENNPLSYIFSEIMSSVTETALDANAVVVDTLSDYFDFETENGVAKVTVRTSEYDGKDGEGVDQWKAPEDLNDQNIECTLNGKTISVSGYDFAAHYVGFNDGTPRGQKLVIQISTVANVEKIDEALQKGTLQVKEDGKVSVPTNKLPAGEEAHAAQIQANEQMVVDHVSPTVEMPVHTFTLRYDKNTGNDEEIVMPGESVAYSVGNIHTFSVESDESKIPTRNGYTFLGWAESSDATSAKYPVEELNQTIDLRLKGTETSVEVTLYAVWKKDNITPPQPVVPNPPAATDLSAISVKVGCVAEGAEHENDPKTYGLLEGTYDVTSVATNEEDKYQVTVTLSEPAAYVSDYNTNVAPGHKMTEPATSLTQIKMIYNEDTNSWAPKDVREILIKVTCSGDSPVVDTPTAPSVSAINVIVDCENENVDHQNRSYTLFDNTYFVSNPAKNSEGIYQATVTITDAAPYVNAYSDAVSEEHQLNVPDTGIQQIIMTYDAENKTWTPDKTEIVIPVICQVPGQPSVSGIHVKVDCVNGNVTHQDKQYDLLAGSYYVSPVSKNSNGVYQVKVVLSETKDYVDQYNTDVAAGHVFEGPTTGLSQVTMTYNPASKAWTADLNEIVIPVKCGATTPPGPGPSDPTYTTSITVKKEWKLDDGGIRPDSVQVQLYKNGQPVANEIVVLNAANNWSHTWSKVYSYGDVWAVQEINVPEGFTSTVVKADYSNTFTIINDDVKAEDPVIPDDPNNPNNPGTDKPDKPSKPVKPEKPGKADVTKPEPATDVPKTGDEQNLSFWVLLMLATMAALGVTLKVSKKVR